MSARMIRLRLLFAIATLLCSFSFDSLLYSQAQGQQQQADFGRMFPTLPAFQPAEALLKSLALAMQDPNAAADDNPLSVPSGFTYLGQFLDHAEVFGAADATAAGDDDGGLGELRTIAGDSGLT